MGNIGSQSGHLKYKSANSENVQWANSFPRTQTRFQQNQMKVLPEKTPKIRLRHTENGEILQTGGTLTGRQIQNKFGENREIKKCGSEPQLNHLANSQPADPFEVERERKFRKKYKAPPPPNQGAKFNENAPDYWDSRKENPTKPRLFKTKIQSERKRSVPDYHDKSDYFDVPHKDVRDNTTEEKIRSYSPSHRSSMPALNTAWDFQGELKEATRRLRQIRTDDNDEFYSSQENLDEDSKRNKLKTLDHHIDKRDLMKLKSAAFDHTSPIKNASIMQSIRSEPSGKESSTEESPPKVVKETKNEAPKPFYFGMSSSSHKMNDSRSGSKFERNYPDSESSTEMKPQEYDGDMDLLPRASIPKRTQLPSSYSSALANWKQSSAVESRMNPVQSVEYKYSSEENEEPPAIFSIFPTRSRSNDRSRSGDSGISGDGSPAVFEDTPEPTVSRKDKQPLLSIIPSWTPQQDLGDDSSFEEESFSADFPETFDSQINQRHIFSLSLPRDHHLSSYMNSDQNPNETNFDKIRRSLSGILNTINKKEAESTPENERGNWFLNKSCSALNSNTLQLKYSQISDELDEFLSRNTKLNSGRLMYLPKTDKTVRPRRYETRNRQKNVKDEKMMDRPYFNSDNINETKSIPVPASLQDSPVISDRKAFKKKPKRFTFQSTIRQIERRRIAERLSREAEKKEQQRLRELEVMQKVEKEFQKKRAREKVNIKQQLSRYSHETTRPNSSPDLKMDVTPVRDLLQTRSEPDGAVSSSPTSSLSLLDNKLEDTKFYKKNNKMEYVNNNEYKCSSDTSDESRSKVIMQTQVLSEYRQPQREYRDYHSNKSAVDGPRQTTIHPKVTYRMPKTKGMTRHGSNNYRKDFACGIKTKSEASWNQPSQTKNTPNKYYSHFGPLTRF